VSLFVRARGCGRVCVAVTLLSCRSSTVVSEGCRASIGFRGVSGQGSGDDRGF